MSPCTRAARVGWLGVGCLTVASMAASAGQVKLSFDVRSEVSAHDPGMAGPQSQIDTIDRADVPSAQTPINNHWLEYAVPATALRDGAVVSAVASADVRNQVLSVPFAPIGIVGLVGMTTGLLYAGARIVGLRK